jgi:hypothetical protein
VDSEATTIRMELRLDGDLPTGRASDDSGRVREFAGWLGLVAAIDELLSPESDRGAAA